MVRDPVCGMEIDPTTAFTVREHMGQTFYFCSENCVKQFDANPHLYMPQAGSATTGFNPELRYSRVELPVVGLAKTGQPDMEIIRSALEKLNGTDRVIVNPSKEMVEVEYNPKALQILDLVRAIQAAGYQVGGAQKRIGIENIRCASCVGFIEEELKATPGVLKATVNLATQEATVDYLPERTSLDQLDRAIENWGYETRPSTSEIPVDQQQTAHEKEYLRLMKRFWFAAIISIPVLITAYPKFIPVVRDWPMATLRLAWFGAALLTLPVLFWSGSDFFTGAWAALKHRSANMNTLIALGTGAAWLYSTFAILFPQHLPGRHFRAFLRCGGGGHCPGRARARRWSCAPRGAPAKPSRN